MIGKKHRKPARKAAMRRAATLPMIVRKALRRAVKELTATKARAENRNLENRWGARLLRSGA